MWGALDCNPRPITHWSQTNWIQAELLDTSLAKIDILPLYDIFLFGFNVYYTLNARDTLSVRPHFHILTLLWSKSPWLDERLGVWLRLVPWKIGLSPVQADWGRVTAGNSNVTPTLAVKNAQCPRGVALFMWVGVLYTGGTLYSARILGVCLTWICIGGGWPAGWNRVVHRRSS